MEGFEFVRPSHEGKEPLPEATAEDFADTPELYGMLRRLPPELQGTHAARMSDMNDEDAFSYIRDILEKRDMAVRESVVSDASVEPYFHDHQEEIWKHLETDVFTDTQNLLGYGQTARIKEFSLEGADGERIPTAIKYLVTPTEKTLSVSGEHDLILEVERVRAIELAENEHASEVPHIRVPHPFFYYKKGKTQCYGMELIDGINLEQGINGTIDEEVRAELRTALAGISRQALMDELTVFFTTMHEICIHGDMKPANIMVNREGKFYVIDFGQSVLTNDVNDKSRDAFEVLKADDLENAQRSVKQFLDALGV